MTKKALIVGISDYAPLAPNLRSSEIEAVRWEQLLLKLYGFSVANIRRLDGYHATKAATLDRLTWLLADASAGDQLVFVFCGHGLRAPGRTPGGDGINICEEALVLHPAGMSNLSDVSFFDDELTNVYCSLAVASGVLPTFILDCCFSAGIDFAEAERLKSRIAMPLGLAECDRHSGSVVRFGLRLAYAVACTPPLVVAAAGDADLANERQESTVPRSLFSSLAIAALWSDRTLTYEQLLQEIVPDMKRMNQEPCLRGDTERMKRRFLE